MFTTSNGFMTQHQNALKNIVAREHYRQVFDLLIPEYFTSQVEK